MDQPITFLFPSQFTEGPTFIPDDKIEDDDVIVSFVDIQFDPEEENIPDHVLMSSKQFKLLNRKINSLLQLQADAGNRNSVFGIEVDVMLKAQQLRLKALMEQIDTKTKKCLKHQSDSFVHLENVSLKIEELRSEMTKEVVKLDNNYSHLNNEVDIVATIVTKVFEFHNSLPTKIDTKSEFDSKRFAKLEKLLGSLKELLLKLGSSPQSLSS
ncbi:unnamed protein product [Lactuca saligna]|uniref:Uncharacterized protein n=1 Tax=Lactuca saligna TaxID=75948 RepID=A0AA36E9A2_LACSI|nr:unnamed protein product [Lactuca saligna]